VDCTTNAIHVKKSWGASAHGADSLLEPSYCWKEKKKTKNKKPNRSNDSAPAPLAHIKDGPLGQKMDIYCQTDIVSVVKQPFQR